MLLTYKFLYIAKNIYKNHMISSLSDLYQQTVTNNLKHIVIFYKSPCISVVCVIAVVCNNLERK